MNRTIATLNFVIEYIVAFNRIWNIVESIFHGEKPLRLRGEGKRKDQRRPSVVQHRLESALASPLHNKFFQSIRTPANAQNSHRCTFVFTDSLFSLDHVELTSSVV